MMKKSSDLRGLATVALGALLGVAVPGGLSAQWVSLGPSPANGGQVEGITGSFVTGAVEAVVAHPTNPDMLWVGAVNGGIFWTASATSVFGPTWAARTDDQESLSISALELDPTFGNHSVLVAGLGRTSSFLRIGSLASAILRTTDGGVTWTQIPIPVSFLKVTGVAPRGSTIVVAADEAIGGRVNTGIYRTTDTGATWTQISGAAGSGLPIGFAYDLVGDPTHTSRLFTIIRNVALPGASGVYRSENFGATWTKISSAAQDGLLDALASDANLAVGRAGPTSPNVFSAICNSLGQLAGIHRTGNGAAATPTWTALDLPNPTIHPGRQCRIHLSLAADPINHNLVYVGGDRQALPTNVGAADFSGRLFRIDAGLAPGSQAQALTHCDANPGPLPAGCGGVASTTNNSAPHADSREMVFDAAGNLIEVDDGGVYRRTNPRGVGDWFSANGTLAVTEQHDMAHDAVSDITISGNQDNGTTQQNTSALGFAWNTVSTADGGDVVVAENDPVAGQSSRYSSFQNFSALRRRVWNSANVLQATFSPLRLPLGGDPAPTAQFVGPLAVNNVTPTRLIMGAGNGTYESFDRLGTVARISTAVVNANGRGPIAYGVTGNADLLYFGSGDDIHARIAPPPAAPVVVDPDTTRADLIVGLVIDPDVVNIAFAIDSEKVFQTVNSGTSWNDITGNLPNFAPGFLRSIGYINANGDRLVVGGSTGVFAAIEASGFSTWTKLGTGLPSVPVFDVKFSPVGNRLTAGTLGRGSWRLVVGALGCPTTLTLANQIIAPPLTATTFNAESSITMGPGLTSMASGVEIQAPTITLVDSGAVSTYGGDLIIGNTPVCP